MAPSTAVELADVFRRHSEHYRQHHRLSLEQHQVMNAIMNCRTAQLGGHVTQCEHCERRHIHYNSCRNRHCPKCLSLRTAKWLEARRRDLLPVPYFHLVFTLPHELNTLIAYNKKALHDLLFQATWGVIATLGQDRLKGQMGMIAILHTWGQTLASHHHLHGIVPGGALQVDGSWQQSKKGFLFPIKVMATLFRGRYVSALRTLYQQSLLKLPDQCHMAVLLDTIMKKDWIVYAKPPFSGPEKLLDYLGRYTHKIAISNHRIIACDDNGVTFQWRDYADGNKVKLMTLSAEEFIRRFLSHVVPKNFMRIRSFGFLANTCKAKKLERIRQTLEIDVSTALNPVDATTLMLTLTGKDIACCPHCHQGKLIVIKRLPTKFGNTLYDTS